MSTHAAGAGAKGRPKRPPGRPSKLTPEVVSDLVSALETGVRSSDACAFAGISMTLFTRWLDQGAAEEKPEYVEFLHSVNAARARGRVVAADRILKASKHDWRAAAWLLERTDRETFGKRVKMETTGPNDGPLQVEFGVRSEVFPGMKMDPASLDGLSDVELDALNSALAKLKSAEVGSGG